MARKEMIWVAVEDVHTRVVGSLKGFQHKRRMANEPSYKDAAQREKVQPTTLREMLGMTDGGHISMRQACGV